MLQFSLAFAMTMMLACLMARAFKARNPKKVRIPERGYRDLRDSLSSSNLVDISSKRYEGNEAPFADVLHHSRYNLEELLMEQIELIPETLDLIRLEQAEHGENHGEMQADIIDRANQRALAYSSHPEIEGKIQRRLRDLRARSMTVVTDEIQSIVLEVASGTTRIGYSGDDCPQAIFPTILASNGHVGLSTTNLEYARPISLTGRPFKDESSSADEMQSIMDAAFKRLRVSTQDFPLLFIDSPLQSEASLEASRKVVAEMLFEHFKVPALYFGKSSVMSIFSMGRHTGLVLESGAAGSSIVPVYEGIPLISGIVSSPIGGNYLDESCEKLLQSLPYSEHLTLPHANVANKKIVGLGECPQYDLRDVPMTSSYKQLCHHDIVRDFKESVIQVAETPSILEKDLALRPPRYYEFPSGFNRNFGAERFKLGEYLFSGDESGNQGVIDLIKTSIDKMTEKSDRQLVHAHGLNSTLIVSGGTTLTSGFMERLNFDLQTKLPLLGKMRVQAASSSMERRLSPWLGGSILASLGTMQSFWLTKAEYLEHGPSILAKKFP